MPLPEQPRQVHQLTHLCNQAICAAAAQTLLKAAYSVDSTKKIAGICSLAPAGPVLLLAAAALGPWTSALLAVSCAKHSRAQQSFITTAC